MPTRIIHSIVIAALCLLSVFSTGLTATQPHTGALTAPAAMPPHPRLQQAIQSGQNQLPVMLSKPKSGFEANDMQPTGLTGTIKALAVVVNFTDKPNTVTANFFDTLIFAPPVAGIGSVRDYFNEISYGQIDIVTVNMPSALGWQTAPSKYSYYVDNQYCTDGVYPKNCQKLAEDVAAKIDAVVNFADYDNDGDGYVDNLMLIHAGRGAEYTGSTSDIWSHSWQTYSPRLKDGVYVSAYTIMPEYWSSVSAGTSDMTIGVFAHEMGHGFWGLPDLYDYGYDSNGIGDWSLMAGGSWNGNNGNSPAWPDAFNRILMGITTPTSLSGTTASLTIPQAYNNPIPGATIFKLKTSTLASNEYWLIENRQQTAGSYDQYLPGNGLLVWHVDTSKANNNSQCIKLPNCTCGSTHYMVALEQADGLKEMEKNTDSGDSGDPFPGSTNKRQFTSITTPDACSYTTCNESHIRITNISNSGATMTASVQVGAPAISINDISIAEGNSGTTQALFTLSLSNGGALANVTVNYATANGSAIAGQDYTAASGTLTFAPAVTTQTVAVNILGDTTIEPDETFYINLSTPANASISDTQGLATITNDDSGVINITISDVTLSEGNSDSANASFTVNLSASSALPVTVNYATANGTATAGEDYTTTSGTVTLAAGETSKLIQVAVNGDTLDENNETFYVNLSNPTNAIITDNQGIGTINDDDLPPTISINDVEVVEGNAGTTTANFTVTLSAASSFTVTVNYLTADGTATQPSDYSAWGATLSFPPGTTSLAINVPVNGDLLVEPDETFYINLSTPANASISDTQGLATITNDDFYRIYQPIIMR